MRVKASQTKETEPWYTSRLRTQISGNNTAALPEDPDLALQMHHLPIKKPTAWAGNRRRDMWEEKEFWNRARQESHLGIREETGARHLSIGNQPRGRKS